MTYFFVIMVSKENMWMTSLKKTEIKTKTNTRNPRILKFILQDVTITSVRMMGFEKKAVIHCIQKCVFFTLICLVVQTEGVQNNGQRSMYFLCPPKFIQLGNECYFISQDRVNWLDAHFECKERNSRLAEPIGKQDRFLRKYLTNLSGSQDMWIGARYNWERNKWQWGYNGEDVKYQAFSQMSAGNTARFAHLKITIPLQTHYMFINTHFFYSFFVINPRNTDLIFHCAVLKSKLKYRWSASSCEQPLQYVCQHKLKMVNEKKRQDIYDKWNATYPNEKANEAIHMVSRNDLIILKERRSGLTYRAHNRDNHLKNAVYQKSMRNNRRGLDKQFDFHRYRTQGKQQNRNNRQWRQKHKWNTQLPSNKMNYATQMTTISVAVAMENSTTNAMQTITKKMTARPVVISEFQTNDFNHYGDQNVENGKHIKYQNNMNQSLYQTDQRVRSEFGTNHLGNQTNNVEVFVATTTLNPREIKKRKLKDLRNHLSKLTQQQQNEFFKRRAERNRKRGITFV
ncbi:uncharacterized protein LOC116347880 isoform X2 [Contarinia nasturtii]|uniref:uncharacterized protein LOC116347880 isoform X2 n=1 Tax=Contarinia nasturtii TaxID=265458 RepID=UPI0012D38BAC|nr:uncharacterized protein LOC116347880 isoform X2 [Contarinia nasturtii]